jgi:hypothetical protein
MNAWVCGFAYNEGNGRSVDEAVDISVDAEWPGFQVSVRHTASPEPDGLSGSHSSRTHVASSVVTSGDL